MAAEKGMAKGEAAATEEAEADNPRTSRKSPQSTTGETASENPRTPGAGLASHKASNIADLPGTGRNRVRKESLAALDSELPSSEEVGDPHRLGDKTIAKPGAKGRSGIKTTNSCYLQAALNLFAVTNMAQQIAIFQQCGTHEKGELTAEVHKWVTGGRSEAVLRSVLAKIRGPFGDGRQHDVGEVLRTVASAILEENTAHRACSSNWADRIAGLRHRYSVEVKCGKCQYGHMAQEDLDITILPVGAGSVQRCLDEAFAWSSAGADYRCENCGVRGQTQTKPSFSQAGTAVIIQLQRARPFDCTDRRAVPTDTTITLPGLGRQLELTAVVSHTGGNNAGHYRVHAYNEHAEREQRWTILDGEHASFSSVPRFEGTDTFLLVYQPAPEQPETSKDTERRDGTPSTVDGPEPAGNRPGVKGPSPEELLARFVEATRRRVADRASQGRRHEAEAAGDIERDSLSSESGEPNSLSTGPRIATKSRGTGSEEKADGQAFHESPPDTPRAPVPDTEPEEAAAGLDTSEPQSTAARGLTPAEGVPDIDAEGGAVFNRRRKRSSDRGDTAEGEGTLPSRIRGVPKRARGPEGTWEVIDLTEDEEVAPPSTTEEMDIDREEGLAFRRAKALEEEEALTAHAVAKLAKDPHRHPDEWRRVKVPESVGTRFPRSLHTQPAEGNRGGESGWAALNWLADEWQRDRANFIDLFRIQTWLYTTAREHDIQALAEKPQEEGWFTVNTLRKAARDLLGLELTDGAELEYQEGTAAIVGPKNPRAQWVLARFVGGSAHIVSTDRPQRVRKVNWPVLTRSAHVLCVRDQK
ncbi:hypothetical protein DIPPA_23746 [Diplonema papillatum]|nr:hypothetical protein DIPPA_11670 [Diplonema papillatum]KAJ9473121.1 hypothetical protein DIPPA_23746 [Diplonema papillatum]